MPKIDRSTKSHKADYKYIRRQVCTYPQGRSIVVFKSIASFKDNIVVANEDHTSTLRGVVSANAEKTEYKNIMKLQELTLWMGIGVRRVYKPGVKQPKNH